MATERSATALRDPDSAAPLDGQAARGGGRASRSRAILIDDQLVYRLGLRLFLSRALPEVVIMGEADTAEEGVRLADRIRPELALLDASLPDAPVEETVRQIAAAAPHCRLMVLANLPDTAGLVPALAAGAHGCLLKTIPPEQLASAIRQVIAGAQWVQPELADRFSRDRVSALAARAPRVEPDRPLTKRELDVLRLIVAGYSNAEIARELRISEQTVKTHLAHLMRKIEVRSRLQAARYAISRGLVEV